MTKMIVDSVMQEVRFVSIDPVAVGLSAPTTPSGVTPANALENVEKPGHIGPGTLSQVVRCSCCGYMFPAIDMDAEGCCPNCRG